MLFLSSYVQVTPILRFHRFFQAEDTVPAVFRRSRSMYMQCGVALRGRRNFQAGSDVPEGSALL